MMDRQGLAGGEEREGRGTKGSVDMWKSNMTRGRDDERMRRGGE